MFSALYQVEELANHVVSHQDWKKIVDSATHEFKQGVSEKTSTSFIILRQSWSVHELPLREKLADNEDKTWLSPLMVIMFSINDEKT